ncbi:MAG: LOG family protein [Betaproteobacteria bacterium]|nr:LOG family protein [Betaproteobacteria bacterium]MDE2423157.1 LOG family protein [Betaproteobacteria bacterium]
MTDKHDHDASKSIPKPPHPLERVCPLPWEHPVSPQQAEALKKQQQEIMDNPSYIEPDRDVAFIHEDELRGVRLQLDYTKAEATMNAYGIHHAVVVFGSTRLKDERLAKIEHDVLLAQLAKDPTNTALQQQVRLSEKQVQLSKYYEVGRQLGQLVGQAGYGPEDSSLVIMTGGGPGGMEAANRGAFEVGARTVGLNITLPREQYPNPYITPGLCFQFHYFALRKLHFMKRAVALIALPGGYGTLDELFGALTLIQTRKITPIPIVLVGESFWREIISFERLLEYGNIDPEDMNLFWYAETADEVWRDIKEWHRNNGTDIFDGEGRIQPRKKPSLRPDPI